MTDRPKQDEPSSLDKEPFEEALDAAEVFSELADEEATAGSHEPAGEQTLETIGDAFADEFELAAQRPTALAEEDATPVAQTEEADAVAAEVATEEAASEAADSEAVAPVAPVAQPAPALARSVSEASIGALFKPVVKHSPPSRIRIEADSVGALFRRFIEQE
jgi:hypothetical protein